MKNSIKQDLEEEFDENTHIQCDICYTCKSTKENYILKCKDCKLHVHTICYGILGDTNELEWLCECCKHKLNRDNVRCILCPYKGGALKPVKEIENAWCHVNCGIWIQEINFEDDLITFKDLTELRIRLQCSICLQRGGCIQCNGGRCAKAFHVTCALRSREEIILTCVDQEYVLSCYCHKHLNFAPQSYDIMKDRKHQVMIQKKRRKSSIKENNILNKSISPLSLYSLDSVQTQTSDSQTESQIHQNLEQLRKFFTGENNSSKTQPTIRSPKHKAIIYNHNVSKLAKTHLSKRRQKVKCPSCDMIIKYRLFEEHLFENTKCKDKVPNGFVDVVRNEIKKRQRNPISVVSLDDSAGNNSNNILFTDKDKIDDTGYSLQQKSSNTNNSAGILFPDWPGKLKNIPMDTSFFWKSICPSFFPIEFNISSRSAKVIKECSGMSYADLTMIDNIDKKINGNKEKISVTRTENESTISNLHNPFKINGLACPINGLSNEKAINLRFETVESFNKRKADSKDIEKNCFECQIYSMDKTANLPKIKTEKNLYKDINKIESKPPDTPRQKIKEINVLFCNGDNISYSTKYCISNVFQNANEINNVIPSTKLNNEKTNNIQTNKMDLDSEMWNSNTDIPHGLLLEYQPWILPNVPLNTLDTGSNSVDDISYAIRNIQENLNEIYSQNQSKLFMYLKYFQYQSSNQRDFSSLSKCLNKYLSQMNSWKNICRSLMNGVSNLYSRNKMLDHSDEISKNDDQHDNAEEDNHKSATRDDTCSICFEGSSHDFNPIIFCDECNIAVHKHCYGIKNIPEGDFFCDKCSFLKLKPSSEMEIFCQLCPYADGAIKRCTNDIWVHPFCALWCPTVWIEDLTTMQNIKITSLPARQVIFHSYMDKAFKIIGDECEGNDDDVTTSLTNDMLPLSYDKIKKEIPSLRSGSLCEICHVNCGATVRCCEQQCTKSFHPLCAIYHGFQCNISIDEDLGYIYAGGGKGLIFETYCNTHSKIFIEHCITQKLKPKCHTYVNFIQQNKSQVNGFYIINYNSGEKHIPWVYKRRIVYSSLEIPQPRQNVYDIYPEMICSVCFCGAVKDNSFFLRCVDCGVVVHHFCLTYNKGDDIRPCENEKQSLHPWSCQRCNIAKGSRKQGFQPRRFTEQCSLCKRYGGYLIHSPNMSLIPATENHLPSGNKASEGLNDWVHLFCSQHFPETMVRMSSDQGHIFADMKSTKRVHAQPCVFCGKKNGMLDKCCKKTCGIMFHPLCARLNGCFYISNKHRLLKNGDKNKKRKVDSIEQYYCYIHTPAASVYDPVMCQWISGRIIDNITEVRLSLENARMLTELCYQREKKKRKYYGKSEYNIYDYLLKNIVKKEPQEDIKKQFESYTGKKLSSIRYVTNVQNEDAHSIDRIFMVEKIKLRNIGKKRKVEDLVLPDRRELPKRTCREGSKDKNTNKDNNTIKTFETLQSRLNDTFTKICEENENICMDFDDVVSTIFGLNRETVR